MSTRYDCDQRNVSCGCSYSDVVLRPIPGSEDVVDDSWSMIVSLRLYQSEEHFCAGTLLSSSFVLTAAHCVEQFSTTHSINITVDAGITSRSDSTGYQRDVQEIHIHPNYTGSPLFLNNIAVLQIDRPLYVQNNPVLAKTCVHRINSSIPTDEQHPKNGTPVVVIGWGAMRSGNFVRSDALKQIKIYAMHNQDQICNGSINNGELQFCAGLHHDEQDACLGDSGGPVFYWTGNYWEQVGVIGYNLHCGRAGQPAVYTRPSYYWQWMETILNMKKEHLEPQDPSPFPTTTTTRRSTTTRMRTTSTRRTTSTSLLFSESTTIISTMQSLISTTTTGAGESLPTTTTATQTWTTTTGVSEPFTTTTTATQIWATTTAVSELFTTTITATGTWTTTTGAGESFTTTITTSTQTLITTTGTGELLTTTATETRTTTSVGEPVTTTTTVTTQIWTTTAVSEPFTTTTTIATQTWITTTSAGVPVATRMSTAMPQTTITTTAMTQTTITTTALPSPQVATTTTVPPSRATYECDRSPDECGCSLANVVVSSQNQQASSINTNSEDAYPYSWSMVVSIRMNDTKHKCVGTILSDSFILTAAHCVSNQSSSGGMTIAAGIHSLSQYTTSIRTIDEVHIHENYSIRIPQLHDIAILHLDQPLELKTQPVFSKTCLPNTESADSMRTSTLISVGWRHRNLAKNEQNTLQQVALKSITNPNATCFNSIYNHTYQFCAGLLINNLCEESFGEPVFIYRDNYWEQMGILSQTTDCVSMNHSGIYTRLSPYTNWMQRIMKNITIPMRQPLRSDAGSKLRQNILILYPLVFYMRILC